MSLASFILKTLERLVERYMKDEVHLTSPLHRGQHAFQADCSVETTLHVVVAKLVQQFGQKGYAVGKFLDIESAFSNTPPEVICREDLRCRVPNRLVSWIGSLLRRRRLETRRGEGLVKGVAPRGCPEGGVDGPYKVALRIVELWCESSWLSINSEKISMVIFTKNYELPKVDAPVFCSGMLTLSDSVKYLGVILDSKLNWAKHLETQCRKFVMTFWMCGRAFGLTWRIGPIILAWL
ncbi:uncharacterized protein LOC117173647 [Belonocnema kinseyi]|uniref:uncharacterized protein LOC117173647 n=1 Tax=Belonocnema kinseyi TaxID=2817044 RepID=UPI00143DCFDF|nr:uncharacterized protein LOC117173647 [Belonocnema kinseyi]